MPPIEDPTQNSAAGFFANQAPTNTGPDLSSTPAFSAPSTPQQSAPSQSNDVPGFSYDPVSGPPKLGPDNRAAFANEPNIPAPPAPTQPSQSPFSDAANQQAQPPQQMAPPSWAQNLQLAGIDPSGFRSPEDLANAYLQSQRQMQEMQTYAQYGQQFLPYASQFNEFLQTRQQAQAQHPQQPAAPKKSIEETLKEHWNSMWKAPEYDPSWDAMVKMNPETGFYEGISPFVPAQVVQGMNSRRDWMRNSLNKMLENPFELQWKALQPGIQHVIQQEVQRELSSYNVNREFDALEQEYAQVLYQHDQGGNRVVDPFTGQPRWTPFGAHVAEEMRRLNAAGLTDPFVNFEYAVNSAKAMLFDQSRQQAQQPQAQQPQMTPPQQMMQPQGYPGQQPQYQGQPQQYQQPAGPQYPSPAQHFGLQPPQQPQFQAPGVPNYAPPGAAQFNSPVAPVPSMYQPAVSAAPPMYGGYQVGMNGQLPMGGGFVPQPPSFLDRARMVTQQSHMGDQAVPPSGYESDDFFSKEASKLGYLAAA